MHVLYPSTGTSRKVSISFFSETIIWLFDLGQCITDTSLTLPRFEIGCIFTNHLSSRGAWLASSALKSRQCHRCNNLECQTVPTLAKINWRKTQSNHMGVYWINTACGTNATGSRQVPLLTSSTCSGFGNSCIKSPIDKLTPLNGKAATWVGYILRYWWRDAFVESVLLTLRNRNRWVK